MINKTSEQLCTLIGLLAFFYFDRIRALLCVSGLLLVAVSAHAETKIHALTKVIEGHGTGGVTVDALGNIYVADFGEIVWKITPEGKRDVFASGLYGASGNAIDHEGNLLQSNFYGDSITKIDRKGQAQPFATSGLSGPVGIAINKQTGRIEGVPEIITRGFVMEDGETLLADGARVLSDVVDQASVEERTDQGLIKEKLRQELRSFLRKRSGRRPFVLPVIMEI
jgi:hypothetical protein